MPKSAKFQVAPRTPDFAREAAEAVEYDGLPPIAPEKTKTGVVIFTNVSSVMVRADAYAPAPNDVISIFGVGPNNDKDLGVAIVAGGHLKCAGLREACASFMPSETEDITFFDLDGGALAPALVSFSPNLGLEEIEAEESTRDGSVFDALGGPGSPPSIIGSDGSLIRAADGLVFATRHA